MKLTSSVKKNLKLLFRSKESAYTIVFGPILIILLVSFAFMGASDQYTVRVGTFAPAQTQLSVRVSSALAEQQYAVTPYDNEDACIRSVKDGQNHACITFSEREAGNGTVPITFHLDLSRTNIAYKIIDDLSGVLDVHANEIRAQLAGDALGRMSMAAAMVERDLNETQAALARVQAVQQDLQTARASLQSISNASMNVTLAGLRGYQLGLDQNAHIAVETSTKAMEDADKALWMLERECPNCSTKAIESARLARGNISEASEKARLIVGDKNKRLLADADDLLRDAAVELANLNASLVNDSVARRQITISVSGAAKTADENTARLQQVALHLRDTRDLLRGEAPDANTISKPVTVSVKGIAVNENQLGFTYPYLLVLVIMFIGTLLASTLIVADKTSQAAFRNFTTPTSDHYHIAAAFVTAFMLLVAEVAVMLAVSTLFVPGLALLSASTIIIVLIAIIIFTFIGMIIGYLAGTQQAAMIASISIGSVLLFASNLIIPVEGMAQLMQSVSRFNPYLVLSELLRKGLLYGISFQQISRELILLGALCAALFVVTLYIQRRMKKKYFRQDGSILTHHAPTPLLLGTRSVHNEIELLDALDHMTRAEFEAIISSEENTITVWVAKELRNKSLARKLRTTSKERMILRIDEYLKKHGKHIKQ